MKEKIYHCMNSCNACGGDNEIVKVTDTINGHIMECQTKCNVCDHKDNWCTGFFESSCCEDGIESKCRKY
jgi:hypothetical protein